MQEDSIHIPHCLFPSSLPGIWRHIASGLNTVLKSYLANPLDFLPLPRHCTCGFKHICSYESQTIAFSFLPGLFLDSSIAHLVWVSFLLNFSLSQRTSKMNSGIVGCTVWCSVIFYPPLDVINALMCTEKILPPLPKIGIILHNNNRMIFMQPFLDACMHFWVLLNHHRKRIYEEFLPKHQKTNPWEIPKNQSHFRKKTPQNLPR